MTLHRFQLLVFVVHLRLFCLDDFALSPLIGGILADKPQTAIHLGKVLG